jgi:hypothetical protein
VRAIDAAGNRDGTPAERAWTIQAPADTTAPETTISNGPTGTTTQTSATFTFSANETATFECSLDGVPFAACASPVTYNDLAVGNHTFAVRATDAAGNVDQSPATRAWTITQAADCGAPITVQANADAWIDQNSRSSNHGTTTLLSVQGRSDRATRALVRFSLPAAPPGCTLQSATLRLYAGTAAANRTLRVLQVSSSWSESSVTWNNQPSTTGSAASTTSGSGYIEWNVSAQVNNMINGNNYGFLIRDANEKGSTALQQFHSRENGTNQPQLIVTFGPAGG